MAVERRSAPADADLAALAGWTRERVAGRESVAGPVAEIVASIREGGDAALQDAVARFTDERVIPIIGDCFDKGEFPHHLIAEMAEMGLLGSSLPTEYGCAGMNAVSWSGTVAKVVVRPKWRYL